MEDGWFLRNDLNEKKSAVISLENFGTLEKRIDAFVQKRQRSNMPFDSKEKRGLWRELQELEYHLPQNPKLQEFFTPEKVKELEARVTPKLSPSGFSLYGVLRLLGVLFSVLWMFPCLLLLSTLRLLASLWKTLGFENGRMPQDIVQTWATRYWLLTLGINIHTTGSQHFPQWIHSSTLGFFQHASNLDALIIHSSSPTVFKWIGKKSLFKVPILGQMIMAFDVMIGIDRANKENAIHTLQNVKNSIDKYKTSVAISPEGTRSKLGQLIEFKKGLFHLAIDCKVPIVPIIIYGAFELLPPHQKIPGTGDVYVHYGTPIPYSEYKNMDYNQLLIAMRKHMLKVIEENFPEEKPERSLLFTFFHFLSLPVNFFLFYSMYSGLIAWILSFLF